MKEILLGVKCLSDRPEVQHSLMEIKTDRNTYYEVWEYKLVEREYIPERIYETNIHKYCKERNIDYYFYEYERNEDECETDRNGKEFSIPTRQKV